MKLVKLACPSCGAPLSLSSSANLMVCPFCETRTALSAEGGGVELVPSLAAAFRVDRERFELALLEFLAEGDLTPDDIFEKALVTDRTGVLLPFYELTGEYKASFTASAGYDRQEKTHIIERDASGKEKRRTRTETVTDWRPMSGEASARYTVWLSASKSLDEALRPWAEGRASGGADLRELDEELVGDSVLEDHAFAADEALQMGGRERLEGAVRKACRERVPGDRCKDLKVDFSTRDEGSRTVHLPFWLATFRYGEESFAVGVCGRDARQVEGKRPVDKEREARLKALSLPFKVVGGVTAVAFVVGLCLGGLPSIAALLVGLPATLFFGWWGKKQQTELVETSKRVRAEVLERIKRGEREDPPQDAPATEDTSAEEAGSDEVSSEE